MKKINIDLSGANSISGISNYIRNIASRLNNGNGYKFTGCTYWYRNRKSKDFFWFNCELSRSIVPDRFVHRNNFLVRFKYEDTLLSYADLNVFLTYHLPNLSFRAPVVSTIHDIILLKTNCESHATIKEHEKILRETIAKSKYILSVSEASKYDIAEYFQIDPNNIGIVHNGVDATPYMHSLTSDAISDIRRRYNLPLQFILNFGAYRKHKNLERLLEAYSLLPADIRKEIKLVLTRGQNELKSYAKKLGIANDISFLGFVNEEDKPALLKMAKAIYYCSLYEGFGVPIIEAQAAGVPVITSNTSSLPEAAGNGALLVNPYSSDEISKGLFNLVTDDELSYNLVKQGNDNFKQYTWDRSVSEFYDFLNNTEI